MKRLLWWVLLMWCFVFAGKAMPPNNQPQNVVGNDVVDRQLVHDAWFIEDSTHHLSLQQVASGACDSLFKPQQLKILSFKYSTATYWIKVKIHNDSPAKRDLVLHIPSSNIDELSLYKVDGDTVSHIGTTGLAHVFNNEHIFNGDYFFKIPIKGHEEATLYLRAQNDLASLRVPLFLWDEAAFAGKQQIENLGWGVFFGIMVLIIFFNLTVYYYVKDPINLYYVAYVLSLFIYQVNSKGLMFEFVYPNKPHWNVSVLVITTIVTIVGLLSFSMEFLNVKRYSITVYRIITGVMLVMLGFFAVWPLRHIITNHSVRWVLIQLFNFMPLVCFVLLLYVVAKGIKQKDPAAKTYLLAFAPIIVATIFMALRNNNLAPYYGIFDYRIPVSFSFELIVFSFSLAYRFKLLKDEGERLLIEKTELQVSRFKAVIEATENERKRIAQDLHDGLGQLLSTAKLNISSLDDSIAEDDRRQYNHAMDLIDEACQEVRSISHNMMPSTLIRMGLLPALKELADKANIPGQVSVKLVNHGLTGRLDESREIAIYRVIQEVVGNSLKFAEATQLTIEIKKNEDQLEVKITDNGKGFDTATINQSTGIGWRNIYSRVSMLNGQVKITSAAGKGTCVEVVI